MALKKGNSGNPAGKPKGAKNKVTLQLRELISQFLEERFETIVTDFKKLEPKERVKFYCDLLQFGLPKLQSVSTEIDFEKLTDEQLDEIIERLKKSSIQ